MIHACEAGKDVYVEKPLSLVRQRGAGDGRGRPPAQPRRAGRHAAAVGAVRAARRPSSSAAARSARSRSRARSTSRTSGRKGIGNPPDEAPPAGFDWDAWLGPAPKRAYNKNRTFYRFRWFYDYSGGQLTNFGVHYLDVDPLGARARRAAGGRRPWAASSPIEDNREIPDTLEVLWHYPGGTLVTFSQFNATAAPAAAHSACEIEFRGTKGTLYLHGDGYEIVPDVDHAERVPGPHAGRPRSSSAAGATGPSRMIEPRKRRRPRRRRRTTPATSSTA